MSAIFFTYGNIKIICADDSCLLCEKKNTYQSEYVNCHVTGSSPVRVFTDNNSVIAFLLTTLSHVYTIIHHTIDCKNLGNFQERFCAHLKSSARGL